VRGRCQIAIAALLLIPWLAEAPKGHSDLLDQLSRAASSVSLNIAEAAGRATPVDAARVYALARGSAMECAAVLDALAVLKGVKGERREAGMALLERVVAMLTRIGRS